MRLHHVSLLVADTARAVDFYCGVLGLELASDRPDLGFPGARLSIGGGQIHSHQVGALRVAVRFFQKPLLQLLQDLRRREGRVGGFGARGLKPSRR